MRKILNYENYVGKKYNNLLILELIKKNDTKVYYYKCKCDCGKEKVIRAYNVIFNVIKSCGCKKYEKNYSEEQKEMARQMGLKNRIHIEKCDYCGAENHYAKGLCKNCYNRKIRNGDLELHKKGRKRK